MSDHNTTLKPSLEYHQLAEFVGAVGGEFRKLRAENTRLIQALERIDTLIARALAAPDGTAELMQIARLIEDTLYKDGAA